MDKVKFKDIFEFQSKSHIKAGSGLLEGKYNFYICSDTQVKKYNEYQFDKPALIFGTGGKPSVHFCDSLFSVSTDCIVAYKTNDDVLEKYFYYWFRQLNLRILELGFRGTGLKHISKKYIQELEIPLPPLPEQNRIVEKLDELFSELDNGIETLQKTKAQLKVYRQAVLKDAFEGIDEYDSIKNKSIIVTSGSRGWAKYYSNIGSKFIRITNLTRDGININYSEMKFVDLPSNTEGIRSKLQSGDVLISITADLGSIGLVGNDIGDAYINQHIALVRFENVNQSKFYAFYLKSDLGNKELLKNKRGAGKLGLGLDDIRDSKIPVVEDAVANQIVQEIESHLSICDQIEKTVDESLRQAESLRQSILKQAFEGRLV